MAVKPIPDGYHMVTPYLTVQGMRQQIDFLKKAFHGEELFCMHDEDGNPRHAEVKVGDSILMIGEARDDVKPMAMQFYLYVKDVDATYKQAILAGGTSIGEPENKFYGDRVGGVKDLAGNMWWIGTHVEDLTPTQIQERASQLKT